jgi:proline iminopeptidase
MRVRLNGAELEVEILGAEDAPVLIAHHGAPGIGSRAEPKASFGPLSDTYRVIVFDARGSGDSSDTPPYTHAQWSADVDALRDWAGAEQIVMAGGSYGGFISLEYALAYPERVRALVLRDTAAADTFRASARRRAEQTDRTTIDMDMFDRSFSGQVRDNADFRETWRAILPLYDHDFDPDSVQARVDAPTYHYQTHNQAFAVNLPQYDLRPRLGEIRCPTLITVGRSDWITPVEASEELAAGIASARLEVFENSGHSPQIEEHDAWLKTVRGFLADVEARRG